MIDVFRVEHISMTEQGNGINGHDLDITQFFNQLYPVGGGENSQKSFVKSFLRILKVLFLEKAP